MDELEAKIHNWTILVGMSYKNKEEQQQHQHFQLTNFHIMHATQLTLGHISSEADREYFSFLRRGHRPDGFLEAECLPLPPFSLDPVLRG
jgi:hypothetical protein